jgi:response regulator of citrate/malate metabolism
MQPAERPTIHWSEAAPLPPDHEIYCETRTYLQEMPRLLDEGHEGKFILIKGDSIVGLFDTVEEALRTGRTQYLFQPFLVRQILEREPLYRISPHCLPCRT